MFFYILQLFVLPLRPSSSLYLPHILVHLAVRQLVWALLSGLRCRTLPTCCFCFVGWYYLFYANHPSNAIVVFESICGVGGDGTCGCGCGWSSGWHFGFGCVLRLSLWSLLPSLHLISVWLLYTCTLIYIYMCVCMYPNGAVRGCWFGWCAFSIGSFRGDGFTSFCSCCCRCYWNNTAWQRTFELTMSVDAYVCMYVRIV